MKIDMKGKDVTNNETWFDWHGGNQPPVDLDQTVTVELRDLTYETAPAGGFAWWWETGDESWEIVAYRIHEKRNDFQNQNDSQNQTEFRMTLRDWFAGQAIRTHWGDDTAMTPNQAARLAYELADAMLEERQSYNH